ILASILFPVFARARENARRASCMSNLKQIGLGAMMYTQDYDESYPYATVSLPTGAGSGVPGGQWISGVWVWQQILYPYTKSMQVVICPSGDTGLARRYQGQYGANVLLTPYVHATIVPAPTKLASVQAPASTYMYMDAGVY